MAWPFTPHTTHSDNTVPKITADEMNQIQAGINAAARPIYLTRAAVRASSLDYVTISIDIPALMILDFASSTYVYNDPWSTTLTPSRLPNTWFYCYQVSTNGVRTLETATTAPASSPTGPIYKGSDETRRYLFAFRTDGSSDIKPFHMLNGRYIYGKTEVVNGLFSSATFTSVSLAASIPPHAQRVRLRLNTGSLIEIRPSGAGWATGSWYVDSNTPIPIDTWAVGQAIEAKCTGTAAITVEGWEE